MPITRSDKYIPLKMKNVTHYPKFATKLQLFSHIRNNYIQIIYIYLVIS